MAVLPVTILFKGLRRYGVGQIKFDLLVSEDHGINSDVTNFTVENGAEISDHIHNQIEKGSITGLISNYSLRGGLFNTNKVQVVFNALMELWKSKKLVDVSTMLRLYRDVAITSMPIMKSADDGESVTIQIAFQKVKIVKLQNIDLELDIHVKNLDTDLNKQVAEKTDVGRTVPKKVSAGKW